MSQTQTHSPAVGTQCKPVRFQFIRRDVHEIKTAEVCSPLTETPGKLGERTDAHLTPIADGFTFGLSNMTVDMTTLVESNWRLHTADI